MKRVLAIACVLLAAGCGGSGKPADPGRAVLGGFLEAAAAGDTDTMRGLLSTQSSRRLDPAALSRLAKRLGPLAPHHRLIVSERITDNFGLAAMTSPRGAYAAALRLEGKEWRLELAGPIKVKPLGPQPGAREPLVQQVAMAADGGSGSGYAVLYLDGVTIPDTKIYSARSKFEAVANLPTPVPRGRHSLVAFVGRGSAASALAWSFSVR